MIDVIIPAYSPSSTIRIGLMSLATQFHKELINIVLVNDCSPNTLCNYADLITEFKNIIKIDCIKTPYNMGQGGARQYGIDHTFNDYFTFMDDDDQFGSNFAIFNLIAAVQASEQRHPRQKCAFSVVPICNLHNNKITTIQVDSNAFVNGRLYCRQFIKEYNIHFHPDHSWVEEDYFFSRSLYFALNCNTNKWFEARVGDDPYAYFWMDNPNSQTQKDTYRKYLDMTHFAETSVDLIKWMEETKGSKKKNIKQELCFMISHTYCHYFTWMEKDSEFTKKFTSVDWERMRTGINKLRAKCQEYNLTREEIKPFLLKARQEQEFHKIIDMDIIDFITKGTKELEL